MKKILSMLIMVFVALSFAACNNGVKFFKDDYVPKYNDVLYDSAVEWIKDEFQNENPVKVIGFIDDDPETRLPETRTFIVIDREQFEEIFVEGVEELEVDFANEMLIVYTFGIEYVLPAHITDMNLSGNTLSIDYTIPLILNSGSAVRPFQRWFVIKLAKIEAISAVFNYNVTYNKR